MNHKKQPSSEDIQYCKQSLQQVSRTFALVISILKGDLYLSVLLAYLLCRIADTIEDNTFMVSSEKFDLLDVFLTALEDKNSSQLSIEKIKKVFENHHTENHDYSLTYHCDIVFRVFDTLDEKSKQAIAPWIREMAVGMKKFQAFSTPSKEITAIKNLTELEHYCYYVAGTVGNMLTELFILHIRFISDKNKETLHRLAVSFGIGLQLTNILKDFNEDLKRGWCYIPLDLLEKNNLTPEQFKENTHSSEAKAVINELRKVARHHLKNALLYTFAIPRTQRQIRLFCLWPLHMANLTLHALNETSEIYHNNTVKISRKEVKQIVLRTNLDWFLNWRQKRFFESFSI